MIHLDGITFNYPGGPPVLNNLSFHLGKGERVGLVGPNGSGKTTLFHVIMGLVKTRSGMIEIFGKPIRQEKDFKEVRQRIGLLFQDADDQLFSPTVLDDVAFGPLNLGKSGEEARDISRRTLERLGLTGFEDRVVHKLSGGEKKLVSLATVLAMEPEILLLDEPSNGLDERTKSTLALILSDLDLSYIVISHEADFLVETTDKICIMQDGRIRVDDEAHLHYHFHEHRYGRLPHEHK